MRFLSTLVALVAALAAATVQAAAPARVEIVSVEERAGRLTATIVAYGPDGLPVANLPAGNLRATLDGAPLTVNSVQTSSTARSPLSVLLLVDTSGSMYGDPIAQARRAITDFVAALEPADEVAVMHFESSARLLQTFTTDKALATQAVNRLVAFGDTALYDGVSEATRTVAQAHNDRKLVVMLSDGVNTVGTDKRAQSLEAARSSGASFVVIGLGAQVDRPYLTEVAEVSSGRFLDAPTPATLREAYAGLAQAIKTQYAVAMTVPASVDRSVAGKLVIRVNIGAESAQAEREIPPLAGAVPPAFDLQVDGLVSGAKVKEAVTLSPVVPAGMSGLTAEYFLDGESIYKTTTPPFSYMIDPAAVATGNHLIRVVITDQRGRQGEKQVSFSVPSPPTSIHLPVKEAAIVLGTGAVLALIVVLLKRRPRKAEGFDERVKPWRGKVADVTSPLETPPGEWQQREMPPAPAALNLPLGRVIVMDEVKIKGGSLDAIHEYEISSSPLVLGSTPECDIIIEDPEGHIAGEEARLWVQRGRLVYHKLTTLSAMATEGVTSGWQFLDSGEDIRVGPCRLTFQLEAQPEPEPVPVAATPKIRELWPSEPVEPLGVSSD